MVQTDGKALFIHTRIDRKGKFLTAHTPAPPKLKFARSPGIFSATICGDYKTAKYGIYILHKQ